MTFFSDDLAKLRQARLSCRFRIAASSREHSGETMGISPDLLILGTTTKLHVGLHLHLLISVPVEVSGRPFSEISDSGRITSKSELPDGVFGYQVALEPNP